MKGKVCQESKALDSKHFALSNKLCVIIFKQHAKSTEGFGEICHFCINSFSFEVVLQKCKGRGCHMPIACLAD